MRIVLLILFCYPLILFSQSRLSLTAFGGIANYHGDLQQKRLSFGQSNFTGGLGIEYELTPKWSVRGELRYGHLQAHDSVNSGSLRLRNLHFKSRLYEASFLGQYNFGDILENKIVPYVFAGLAVYHFSPFTFDSIGKKVFLQPLGTEGQGLAQYPDRKVYNLNQLAIPFGAGLNFAVNERVSLGFEFGLRKLFTDYLDDVSTTYVDQQLLLAGRGQRSVDYAYRGDELKDGDPAYPIDGRIRGGKAKDWYYHTGIIARFRIFNVGYRNSGSGNSLKQMDCPRF